MKNPHRTSTTVTPALEFQKALELNNASKPINIFIQISTMPQGLETLYRLGILERKSLSLWLGANSTILWQPRVWGLDL
ncbi:hypothetical protein Lal_00032596 [Lupinus albus]|nr:hypothetical protein Lal_00032596 [Lupinus albus]